jgi:hypothetical protein
MTNTDQLGGVWDLHYSRFRSRNLSFLHSPEYIIFWVDFLHTGRIHNHLHARFFSEFFNTLKYQFQKNQCGRLCIWVEFIIIYALLFSSFGCVYPVMRTRGFTSWLGFYLFTQKQCLFLAEILHPFLKYRVNFPALFSRALTRLNQKTLNTVFPAST